MKHGTDANWKEYQGSGSLFYFACLELWFKPYALAKTVQYLLEYGADPLLCTAFGEIPLHAAIFNGQFQTVYCLLNHPKVRVAENDALTLSDKQITLAAQDGKTPLRKLLESFIMPPEAYVYDYWNKKKLCLYAVLLSDIDVKSILPTLGFNAKEYDAIHTFVTEAEAFIARMKKEFGRLGEEVVHQCIFSSEQEREAFSQEKFWVRWSGFFRNEDVIKKGVSIAAKGKKADKKFPAELAILVAQYLAPKPIHFFSTIQSKDKALSVDETQDNSQNFRRSMN